MAPTRTWEALASWLIRGLSLGCYSAPRRRVSISMTMKPVATIAAFKFSVSAKSAAALEKFEEGGHAAIRQEGVRRPITLNGTMSADAKPAGDVSAPPRRWPTGDSFAPAPSQHSGLPPRSQAAASASRCCGPPRGRGFSLSFGWEAMQRLRPIFVIGSPYCPLPEVLCDHRPSA